MRGGRVGIEPAAGRMWDAILVGAGPAGAVASRALARDGAEVLLIDRATFPRDKVCGGCLNARSVALLERAGLRGVLEQEGAASLERIELITPLATAGVDLPPGAALSRRRFDAALVDAALAAGVSFLEGCRARLGEVDSEHRSVLLPAVGESLRARVVLAADGLGGGFVPAEVIPRQVFRRSRLGAWTELPSGTAGPKSGTLAMAVAAEGYVGVVRVEGGLLNVAAALDPAPVREDGLARVAARILESTKAPSAWAESAARAKWRGTGPLTSRARSVAGERLFLIGDSAGYVEPFTGEGMAWALGAALELAPIATRAIDGWSPGHAAEWSAAHSRAMGRHQRRCRFVARAVRHPYGIAAAAWALAAGPNWAAPIAHRLGGVGEYLPPRTVEVEP